MEPTPTNPPMLRSIAGSDSGGCAGLQADLKTWQALQCHGTTVVTAVTAQNATGVRGINPVPPDMVAAQLAALGGERPPAAIKTGMLHDARTVRIVADSLTEDGPPVVCDPVLAASTGHSLQSDDLVAAIRRYLLPRVHLLMPNIPEAEALTGRPIRSRQEVMAAAGQLLETGAERVLIKGGHLEDGEPGLVGDYYLDDDGGFWIVGEQRQGEFHGSGCSFAAAVCAGLGTGLGTVDAIIRGRLWLAQQMRWPVRTGPGRPALRPQALAPRPDDMPWICTGDWHRPQEFPAFGEEPPGLYPIVDRAAWLERLLPLGVRTAQIRIKDLQGTALEEELARAIATARQHHCRLFVNDHWREAIRLGAWGVHLGQEDLETADRSVLLRSGLRLGISTHCYEEAAIARAWSPSCIAIGPVFPTTCKSMAFGPRGIAMATSWVPMFSCPVVGIGGLKPDHVPELMDQGIAGMAVISDILEHDDPEGRTRQWLQKMPGLSG